MNCTTNPPNATVALPAHIPAETRVECLFSEETIAREIDAMAAAINHTYADCRHLTLIGVLNGSFMFLSDLAKRLTIPCTLEFIRLASYGNNTQSSGTVKPVNLSLPDLTDQDVLVVEDIVDTGLTMQFLLEYLQNVHQTRSLRLAVLLDKPEARRGKPQEAIRPDFTGFTVGNEFLVGYGLDYAGYFRNLPFIGRLVLPQSN
ncbi:MAG: hypoxanthine phosphoribosyltransferase [Candidatus Melainabacteria bacterium]|nr:hypoxanthine phosphoribosyltransferase [Candidatus Melainabacteria bacterium]